MQKDGYDFLCAKLSSRCLLLYRFNSRDMDMNLAQTRRKWQVMGIVLPHAAWKEPRAQRGGHKCSQAGAAEIAMSRISDIELFRFLLSRVGGPHFPLEPLPERRSVIQIEADDIRANRQDRHCDHERREGEDVVADAP